MALKIVVEPKTLERLNGGPITGVIYFNFGDTKFPGGSWIDFPGQLMSWWTREMLRVASAKNANGRFRFMDGCQEVHCRLTARGVCELKGIENGDNNFTREVAISEVQQALAKAADVLADICQQHGWGAEAAEARTNAWQLRSPT